MKRAIVRLGELARGEHLEDGASEFLQDRPAARPCNPIKRGPSGRHDSQLCRGYLIAPAIYFGCAPLLRVVKVSFVSAVGWRSFGSVY